MKIKIGIQGINGSFHSIATSNIIQQIHNHPSIQHQEYEVVEFDRFEDLCLAVHKEKIQYATMAIENSLAGSLLPNYHLMLKYNLFAIADTRIPIGFSLLTSKSVTNINQIEKVISHPMAFHQCQNFFLQNPHLKKEEVFDTAGAAQIVADQKLEHIGALAPHACAELFHLKALYSGIRDKETNSTRFLFLTNQTNRLNDNDHVPITSGILICKIKHQVGELNALLTTLSKLQVQLTNIQSIPDHETYGEYRFIFEFEVERNYDLIIEAFQKHTSEITELANLP